MVKDERCPHGFAHVFGACHCFTKDFTMVLHYNGRSTGQAYFFKVFEGYGNQAGLVGFLMLVPGHN